LSGTWDLINGKSKECPTLWPVTAGILRLLSRDGPAKEPKPEEEPEEAEKPAKTEKPATETAGRCHLCRE
jgi:hypothetical protein